MRPFFPYFGAKWRVSAYLPPPQYKQVVEPFCGAAGYSVRYEPRQVTLIDKNPVICGVWDYLIRVSPEEIWRLPDLPGKGASLRGLSIPPEARSLIGFWFSPGSSVPKWSRNSFSARTAGEDGLGGAWGPTVKRRIIRQLPLIREWQIVCGSYVDAPDTAAAWLIDPPYEVFGREYPEREIDFAHLGPWCEARKGQVIVCEGPGATWLPFTDLGRFRTARPAVGLNLERVWYRSDAELF